jgi:uncharacterized protein YutD
MNETVIVQSSAQLEKLFNAFDDMGFAHRYSEELGEFDIKIGNRWVLFQVDAQVMEEERDSERWAADAYAVAETYWRQ